MEASPNTVSGGWQQQQPQQPFAAGKPDDNVLAEQQAAERQAPEQADAAAGDALASVEKPKSAFRLWFETQREDLRRKWGGDTDQASRDAIATWGLLPAEERDHWRQIELQKQDAYKGALRDGAVKSAEFEKRQKAEKDKGKADKADKKKKQKKNEEVGDAADANPSAAGAVGSPNPQQPVYVVFEAYPVDPSQMTAEDRQAQQAAMRAWW
jgi:hypothetical protein